MEPVADAETNGITGHDETPVQNEAEKATEASSNVVEEVKTKKEPAKKQSKKRSRK
jgi:hypothetical protein